MIDREPPRMASFLLQLFKGGPHAESLEGDLQEQFAAGRTWAWYWRQVLIAAATSCGRFARIHGLSFASALAAAWAVMALSIWVNDLVLSSTHAFAMAHRKLVAPLGKGYLEGVFIASTVVRFGVFVLAGWVLARIHRAHRVQAVTLLLITAMLWRFVPQRIVAVYDDWTHVFLHLASAVGGVLIGALILGRPRAPRAAMPLA
jgi:hypothetical protein